MQQLCKNEIRLSELILIFSLLSYDGNRLEACALQHVPMYQPGDQILIGYLPSMIGDNGEFNPQSLLWMELIRYMVDEANKSGLMKGNYMRDFKLGYMVYDTCNSIEMIIKQVLDIVLDDQQFIKETFVSRYRKNCSISDVEGEHLCTKTYMKTTSVIAGALLGVSAEISQHVIPALTGLSVIYSGQNIHVVNFVTSDESIVSYTDIAAQDNVKSTASPDFYYALAIFHFMEYQNWTYVGVLYSEEKENVNRAHLLLEMISASKICIGFEKLISHHDIEKTLSILKNDLHATAVILFTASSITTSLIKGVLTRQLDAKTWIFGSLVNNTEIRSFNAYREDHIFLSLVPKTGTFPAFEDYFWNLNSTSTGNLWLKTFFEHVSPNSSNASSLKDFKYMFNLHDLGFLYNAIASYIAGGSFLASDNHRAFVLFVYYAIISLSSPMISEAIKYSSFTSLLGHKLRYNSNGRLNEQWFQLLVVDRNPGKTDSYCGDWNKYKRWSISCQLQLSNSSCESECPPGYQLSPYKELPCCMTCTQCPSGTAKHNFSTDICIKCPKDSLANENHTACDFFQLRYLHRHSSKGLLTLSLAVIAILMCATIMFTFTLKHKTPVVRASDTRLVSAGLIAHFLICITPALYFGEPTEVICSARLFALFGLLTFQVSVLLVKTERLLQIFAAKKRLKRRSALFTISLEMFLISLLLALGAAISLLFSSSRPISVIHDRDVDTMTDDVYCNYSTHMFLQTTYIAVLTTVCFMHAFRARKLPDNFNETKFIMLTSFVWLSILLASVAIQVSLADGEQKAFIECLVAFLCNTSMMAILFGYKMWIIIFKPSMNTLSYFQQQCFAASQKKVASKLDSSMPASELSLVDEK